MLFNPWPIHQRVVVNLHNGSAVRGVLLRRIGALIVLADAELLSAGHDPAPMDGEVYIEREQVAFIQATLPRGG